MVQQEQLALLARVVMQETQERMDLLVQEVLGEPLVIQEPLAMAAAVAAVAVAVVETPSPKIKITLMVEVEEAVKLAVLHLEVATVAVVAPAV